MIILILPCLNVSYKNLKDSDVSQYKSYSKHIIPCLKLVGIGEGNQQSIELLLSSTCQLEVLRCAVNSPERFYLDQADLLKFKVQRDTSTFLTKEESDQLREQINPINFNYIEALQEHNDDTAVNDFLRLLKDTFIEVLMHFKLTDENENSQGYQYFINILRDQYNVYSEIKINQCENIPPWMELRDLENQDQNDKIKYHNFKQTFYQQFSNMIKKVQSYSIIEDNIISHSYYQQICSQQTSLKTGQNIIDDYNIEQIWRMFENKLNINRENSNHLDNFSQIQDTEYKLKFLTRLVNDKEINKVNSKINRKIEQLPNNTYPYFQHLIKDQKRLSLLFQSEEDIMYQVNKIRQIFGHCYDKEVQAHNGTIKLKIREIKNVFNKCDESITGAEQRDLKIIFEVIYLRKNLCIPIECSCNIVSLMRWKAADHLFQDQIRLEENQKSTKRKITQQEYQESTTRKVIRLMQIILIIYAIISTQLCFIGTYTNQIINIDKIHCMNGNPICLFKCGQLTELNENCIQQVNNFHLSSDIQITFNEIANFCTKFSEDDRIQNECNEMFNFSDKIGFANGIQDFDKICQFYRYYSVNCIEESNITNIIDQQKSQFKDIQLNNYFQMYKDLDNRLIIPPKQQIPAFIDDQLKRQMEKINLPIYDIQISINRVCILTTSQTLHCSSLKQNFDKGILAAGYEHGCLSSFGNLKCFGGNFFGQANVPKLWSTNIVQIMCGSSVTCVAKANGQVFCWGSNKQGILDLPVWISKSLPRIIVSNSKIMCAIVDNTSEVFCWGDDVISRQVTSTQALDVSMGSGHVCFLENEFRIICVGNNNQGQIDAPVNQIDNYAITRIHGNEETNCMLNSIGRMECWGKSLDQIQKMKMENVDQFTVGQIFCIQYNNMHLSCKSPLTNQYEKSNIQLQAAAHDFICEINSNGDFSCNEGYKSLKLPNQLYDKQLITEFDYKAKKGQTQILELNYDDVVQFYLSSNDFLCQKTNDYLSKINCNLNHKKEIIKFSSHFCISDEIQCSIDLNNELRCKQIDLEYIQVQKLNEKLKVKELKCEKIKICILQVIGQAHCSNIDDLKLNLLPQNMNSNVSSIYQLNLNTCILNKYRQIICDGDYSIVRIDQFKSEIPIPNQ